MKGSSSGKLEKTGSNAMIELKKRSYRLLLEMFGGILLWASMPKWIRLLLSQFEM